MARVDPFIVPIPQKIQRDPELRPFFEYLSTWAHDISINAGTSDSTLSDVEGAIASEDGGNRSNRFIRDQIAELWSHLDRVKRQNNRDEIDDLRSEIADLKRAFRKQEQLVYYFGEQISVLKTKRSDNEVFELKEIVAQQKKITRSVEQKINELEERYDSGT